MFELNLHTVRVLLKAENLIAEYDFSAASDLLEQQPRKVTAPQRHKASTGQLPEHCCPKPSHAFASIVNHPQLAHVIACAFDIVCQPYALSKVVTETPKVDDKAAGAQPRSTLDERRHEPSRS